MEKRKIACFIAFIIYVAVVLLLTVVRFGTYHEVRVVIFEPFSELISIYRNYGIALFLWLFLGNIVWFVPFGLMLPMFLKNHDFFLITVLGFLFSITIETLQFAFYKGVAEIDDLILNTFGVFIGYCLFRLFYKQISKFLDATNH